MDEEEFKRQAIAEGWEIDKIEAYLASKRPKPDTSINVKNLARSAYQGATFNFGDEILGKLPEWLGGGEKARDEMRRRDKAFKEEHPVISTAAEIGGGLAVPGFGAIKALGTGAKTIRGAVGSGALIGGVSGGLTGAGAADEAGDSIRGRVAAGILPGLLGATGGAAIPGGHAFLKSALQPGTRGVTRLRKNIDRSGGVDALIQRAKDFDAGGKGQDVMLADLSVPMRQLTDFAANNSETAAEQIGTKAYGRHLDQSERVLKDATNVIGNPQADEIVKDLGRSTARWADSKQGFQGLRDANPAITDPVTAFDFRQYLSDPGLRRTWKQAKEVGLIGPLPKARELSFEVLQDTKERLDYAVGKAYATPGGGDLGARLEAARDGLVGRMQKAIPEYKGRLAEYHRRKDLERMVEAGQKAFKNADSRGLQQTVSQLNPDQLQHFQEGIGSELLIKLRNTDTNQDISKRIVDASPAMKEKIEIVFGSQKAAAAFLEKMKLEREMSKILATLTGSATAKRLAAREGIDPLELGLDVGKIPVAPWSGMSGLASLFAKATGRKVGQGTADRLAPMLTTQGTADIIKLLERMRKQPTLVGSRLSRRVPVGLGVGAGLLTDE